MEISAEKRTFSIGKPAARVRCHSATNHTQTRYPTFEETLRKRKIIGIHFLSFLILTIILIFSAESILNIISPIMHNVTMWINLIIYGTIIIFILTLISCLFFITRRSYVLKKKENKLSEFKCSKCGQVHSDWPALTFNSPTNYHNLSDNEKSKIGKLNTDFCEIHHEDQVDRFIRVTLSQKVKNACETLEYGLWVSLSEKSYSDYMENFNNPNHETGYFGWLCSNIAEYGDLSSVPCDVITKTGNDRPEIFPHNDFNHQFVRDYYNGISKEEAENRISQMIKNVG